MKQSKTFWKTKELKRGFARPRGVEKQITEKDEEYIKSLVKKDNINKILKKMYLLKKKKQKININKYLNLYDDYHISNQIFYYIQFW